MILFNKYPSGKKKAATMSYDDGNLTDIRLIEIFDKYGIKGTFHLNSGLFYKENRINGEDIAEIYKNHEVAAHGVQHATLYNLTNHGVIEEILNDRRELERLTGKIVRGMSYANGVNPPYVAEIAGNCGIEYSRTTRATGKLTLPENFLLWHPTCHHKNCEDITNVFADLTYNSGHLLYIWGHSIEFETDKNWDLIERVCDRLSACEDVWFATNIEIYDYITASRRVRVSVDNKIVENPTNIDVWFTANDETLCVKAGETLHL